MTPEAQRIAIAEACGWTRHPFPGKLKFGPDWESPDGKKGFLDDEDGGHYLSPPDYLNDLNAIHEAENVLTDDQLWDYLSHLFTITAVDGKVEPMQQIRATAAQRSEAFIRTLNLWTP